MTKRPTDNSNKRTIRFRGFQLWAIRTTMAQGMTEAEAIRTLVNNGFLRLWENEARLSPKQVEKLGFWAGLSERYTDWLMGRSLLGTWF